MSWATALPLSERVSDFLTRERPEGVLLSAEQVIGQALAAVRFYRGYARLEEHWARAACDPCQEPVPWLDEDVPLTESEWALIRPLFLLYLERETALMLEASRGLGVDVFGRSTSEIANDIALAEQEMAHRAFVFPVITVI